MTEESSKNVERMKKKNNSIFDLNAVSYASNLHSSLFKNYNQILGLGRFSNFGAISDVLRSVATTQRSLGLYRTFSSNLLNSQSLTKNILPQIGMISDSLVNSNFSLGAGIRVAMEAAAGTQKSIDSHLGMFESISKIQSIAQTITIPEVMIQNSLRSFSSDLNQITKIIGNQIQSYDEQDEYSSEDLERIKQEIQLKLSDLIAEKTLSLVDYVKYVAGDILNDIKSIKLKAVIYFVLFIVIENSITSFINRQLEDCSNPQQAVNAQIPLVETRKAIRQNPNLNKELISNYKLIKYWVSVRTSKTAGSPKLECLEPGTIVRVIEKQKKWSLIEWKYSDTKDSALGFVRSKYLISAWK